MGLYPTLKSGLATNCFLSSTGPGIEFNWSKMVWLEKSLDTSYPWAFSVSNTFSNFISKKAVKV